ncbi:MAG: NHL repeat-containing protein [Pseudomonadota bacterium]
MTASEPVLSNPHDLKLGAKGKSLFVTDTNNNRIVILDPLTLTYQSEFGQDYLQHPHDLDFDAKGRAYVADTGNDRVLIFNLSGISTGIEGELSERIKGPEGVLVHPNGRLYVTGRDSANLVSFADGEVVDELLGLSSPQDVEMAHDNNIWVADSGNNRMLLLTPDLEIIAELRGSPFDFEGAGYQDTLRTGTLVVADTNNHSIKLIDREDRLILRIGQGQSGLGEGVFSFPEGVEVRNQLLWISDSANNRVVKYRLH